MDNFTPAGMLHVCLSISWMRAQVPDSIVETNRAHSDSGAEKQSNKREITFCSQKNFPKKSFTNKENRTKISNRN